MPKDVMIPVGDCEWCGAIKAIPVNGTECPRCGGTFLTMYHIAKRDARRYKKMTMTITAAQAVIDGHGYGGSVTRSSVDDDWLKDD